MNHLQFGDSVIVCRAENAHYRMAGTVQSIDIYGNVKVLLEDQTLATFQREELKLLRKKRTATPYLDDNPGYLRFLSRKYRGEADNKSALSRVEQLKQLIDLALDSRDREWFHQLVRDLNESRQR